MKRHYIKISPSVATWVPDGVEGDWRGRIVMDVAGGSRLVVEPMPSNDLGVRAAVHGDHYYIEIGRDRDPSRSDTVFLLRVESADQRLPRREPVKFACEIRLWPGGVPPLLDPVDDLFDSRFSDEPESESAAVVAQEGQEVSPLLKRLLRTASGELRMHVRPGTDIEEPDEPAAFLGPFRHLWSRLRLDRYLRLSPRHDALIRGHVKPQSLPATQRAEFKAAFGVELLHRIAVDDDSRVVDVVKAIASIPIQATDRAAIWIATLDSLSSAELRRELHESTSALSLLAAEDTAHARAWRSVIAPGLVDLARTSDDELRAAVEDAGDPPDMLQAVIAWARELAFHDERPESESADAGILRDGGRTRRDRRHDRPEARPQLTRAAPGGVGAARQRPEHGVAGESRPARRNSRVRRLRGGQPATGGVRPARTRPAAHRSPGVDTEHVRLRCPERPRYPG